MCACVCVDVGISNTNTPPASCQQIRKLQVNKQSTGKLWYNVDSGLPIHEPFLPVVGKDFLTYRSWLWQWEQRLLPDSPSDQNSSAGSHKFNLILYPIITWLENGITLGISKDTEILDICLPVIRLFTDICFSRTLYKLMINWTWA